MFTLLLAHFFGLPLLSGRRVWQQVEGNVVFLTFLCFTFLSTKSICFTVSLTSLRLPLATFWLPWAPVWLACVWPHCDFKAQVGRIVF